MLNGPSINRNSGNGKNTLLAVGVLQVASLAALAFAYPLFSLLSENAEFFIAHKMLSKDLYVFTAFVLFGPSVALGVMLGFFWLVGEKLFLFFRTLLVILLMTLIVMAFMVQTSIFDGIAVLGVSTLTGLCFGAWFNRSTQLRSILTIISPVNLLIPIVFLFMTDIQDIVSPPKNSETMKSNSASPISVVLIIFDEFTINSLMDVDHNIDGRLFPNFAAFADHANWYRNATTVADGTTHAVPAILSGQYGSDILPTFDAYPQNLFTLLQHTHRLNVHESVTSLCPRELCFDGENKNAGALLGGLKDAIVLYLHIITPASYSGYLPDINQGWTNFMTNEQSVTEQNEDRKDIWFTFLGRIYNSAKPSLNAMHILLPHTPFQYLPSGRSYLPQSIEGLDGERWSNDTWAVQQAWQRHLLQLSYVDKLLGVLVARLKQQSMFEDSMVIITADHGLSFKAQDLRRPLTQTNYMDILPIPLFIKLPNQLNGSVSDLNIETVDILPTIAEVLGIALAQSPEGFSILDQESIKKRKEKKLFSGSASSVLFPGRIDQKYTSVNERIEMFGEGSEDFYSFAADKNLMGRKVDTFDHIESANATVFTEKGLDKQSYGKWLGPNFIRGNVSEGNLDKLRLDLVLAVNGVISAKTKTYLKASDRTRDFLFLVPESAYSLDRNELTIYGLETNKEKKQFLRPFQREKHLAYSMLNGESEMQMIKSETGEFYKVEAGRLQGFLDEIELYDRNISFRGWAISVEESKPASQVALFIDGKFIISSSPKMKRPDVVDAFKESGYLKSGFNFQFELNEYTNLCEGDYTVYALSDSGSASKLSIGKVRIDKMPSC